MDRHAAQMAADPDDQDAAARYAQTLDDAERLEAWDVDARIAAMLAGLGLDDLPTDRLTSGSPAASAPGCRWPGCC